MKIGDKYYSLTTRIIRSFEFSFRIWTIAIRHGWNYKRGKFKRNYKNNLKKKTKEMKNYLKSIICETKEMRSGI